MFSRLFRWAQFRPGLGLLFEGMNNNWITNFDSQNWITNNSWKMENMSLKIPTFFVQVASQLNLLRIPSLSQLAFSY